jgi:hypothetical protein
MCALLGGMKHAHHIVATADLFVIFVEEYD